MYRELQKQNTAFSKLITEYLDKKGRLMPDKYTNAMIKERLLNKDCERGFIFDGYPRSSIQAKFLNSITQIDHVIELILPDKLGIERISGRRICPNGHTYHLVYDPPKKVGVCDKDNLPLKQRSDESPNSLKQRLHIYRTKTKPLINQYRKSGIKVIQIDARPSILHVSKEIRTRLGL